jgi:hypothetical protein
MTVLARLTKLLIISSFSLLLVSFWNRNEIPSAIDYRPELSAEPRQQTTRKRPFSTDYQGITYQVEPKYDYDLYGMVVSYRHHDGESTMHKRSNDHLNTADICVVWGANLDSAVLRRLKFWNGIFTCNVSTKDSDAWSRFIPEQLSNNHLISADDHLRQAIEAIKVGDQIHVQGWLASYASAGGPTRGTSITRTDSGNGACETIFVERFAIIHQPQRPWRIALWGSAVVLLLCLAIHFSIPYRINR